MGRENLFWVTSIALACGFSFLHLDEGAVLAFLESTGGFKDFDHVGSCSAVDQRWQFELLIVRRQGTDETHAMKHAMYNPSRVMV
jgi:hypothetical protein